MAAPQSSKPGSVSCARKRKLFTLAEANRTIPYVSRIVADIVKVHQSMTELQSALEGRLRPRERSATELDVQARRDRLQELAEELNAVGVELKDPQSGIVDFLGRHQGRDVLLCWKLDEARIGYWHEVDSSLAGRQPVSVLDERDPA